MKATEGASSRKNHPEGVKESSAHADCVMSLFASIAI
jgi:hypothetical protein